MAVDDALRVARGAARVTHARRTVLVVDVELDRLRGGEQVLVVQEVVAVEVGGDVALAVVHHHQVADPLERRQQRRQQAEQ